jgi:hypothetical protein
VKRGLLRLRLLYISKNEEGANRISGVHASLIQYDRLRLIQYDSLIQYDRLRSTAYKD